MDRSLIHVGLSFAFTLLPFAPPAAPPEKLDLHAAGSAVLAPTRHPPLPTDLNQIWLVPSDEERSALRAADGRLGDLQQAADLVVKGEHARALAVLDKMGSAESPLADYAQYYRGLALLQLSRFDEARRAFATLQERRPTGYLSYGATLKEAEAAEAQKDYQAAVALYDELAAEKPVEPAYVSYRLGQAALAVGDRTRAAMALARVYYEFPLSDEASSAAAELRKLGDVMKPSRERFQLDLGRAERLFGSRRYPEARDAFTALSGQATGDDRELVRLRIAECQYYLRRYWPALEGLRPSLAKSSRKAEASFFYLASLRAVGRHETYRARAQDLIREFPDSSWAAETLNHLATHYILLDEDDRAAEVFAELHRRFPDGPHAERAAWKAGWWAYRHRRPADTIHYFESAAATFPRSDYRPAYIYWSGRSHDRLGDRASANARYAIVVADYGNTYYGRLAARWLEESHGVPIQTATVALAATSGGAGPEVRDEPDPHPPMPPTEPLIRQLAAGELYQDVRNEVAYAQRMWGTSPALEATLGWAYNRMGELRRGISAMKSAYPQYMASAGADLPEPLLKVLFPVDYWPIIQQHASVHRLDPYLVAALVAQESTFDAKIRSSANAYGLMQLLPSTGRRLARLVGLRYRMSLLTEPEANVRMGTRHFADLVKRFGGPHLALAAYNAGEHRVVQWLAERRGLDLSRDEFIDDIPFPETQNYVKRILGTADDYRRIYGGME